MAKEKKSKKLSDKKAIASVAKEMARPRFAESARKEEEKEQEEVTRRLTKQHSFLNS